MNIIGELNQSFGGVLKQTFCLCVLKTEWEREDCSEIDNFFYQFSLKESREHVGG